MQWWFGRKRYGNQSGCWGKSWLWSGDGHYDQPARPGERRLEKGSIMVGTYYSFFHSPFYHLTSWMVYSAQHFTSSFQTSLLPPVPLGYTSQYPPADILAPPSLATTKISNDPFQAPSNTFTLNFPASQLPLTWSLYTYCCGIFRWTAWQLNLELMHFPQHIKMNYQPPSCNIPQGGTPQLFCVLFHSKIFIPLGKNIAPYSILPTFYSIHNSALAETWCRKYKWYFWVFWVIFWQRNCTTNL